MSCLVVSCKLLVTGSPPDLREALCVPSHMEGAAETRRERHASSAGPTPIVGAGAGRGGLAQCYSRSFMTGGRPAGMAWQKGCS